MEKPNVDENAIITLFESKYLNLYNLSYAPGGQYYNATRRVREDMVALKNTEDFKKMVADAVSCVVILNVKNEEPKLLLSYEYRYPVSQYILGVPAGIIDPEDKETSQPLFTAATRELKEETGLDILDTDDISVINPLLFSTPGMTDESNAIVKIVLNRETMPDLSQDGAVGSECFDGFSLLTKEDARKILRDGADEHGIYYSVYTWIALMSFLSDL